MRKFFVCLCFIAFLIPAYTISAPAEKVAADMVVQPVDTGLVSKGVIGVKYSSQEGKRVKVAIEKSGNVYYYDLPNDGTINYLPLQMNNGSYTINVYEQIKDTSYVPVHQTAVQLALKDPNQVYLQSVQNIRWNKSMKPIKKAAELASKLKRNEDKVKAIHSYIVKNVKYDSQKLKTVQPGYLPSIEATFKENRGICYDYSSLFAAMLRSQGIPAKVAMGYTPGVKGYHAWNEVYIKELNRWVVIDTTVDASSKKVSTIFKKESLYSKEKEY
ncbi:transglutaminase-like domain-containing protein [Bacillus sp. FJAT-27245]|uniref:transglutaminase-like domain-containing protein n=1 Tax=Bacillus sp. FJAT-27245 TaxID=1684144 RepID=UPI0006A76EE2|nr:transglutaminase-like domain-containing protein [Bacillus sp. FJAT-27245]